VGKQLFYRIGEACKQHDIQPYVLRYWETEFPVLSPKKSKAGQRVYSEEELQLIQRIKQLLYEEGYTIAGAKKKLEAELAQGSLPPLAMEESDEADAGVEEVEAADEPAPAKRSAPLPTKATEPTPPPAARLDTEASRQVEKLRTGLQEALVQARDILQLLP